MPRLRMPPVQQAIYDDLQAYTGGAGMINVPTLAQYWGRDVRCVREWIAENALPRYRMGNGYSYQLRDVARAMTLCREEGAAGDLRIYGA